MNRRLLPLLTLLLLGLAAAGSAWAQQNGRQPPVRLGNVVRPEPPRTERYESPRPEFPRGQRDEHSLSDSVRRAQRMYGGRVLGAERVQSGDGEFTRVKLMDDEGRVRYVDPDRQPRSADARWGGDPATP